MVDPTGLVVDQGFQVFRGHVSQRASHSLGTRGRVAGSPVAGQVEVQEHG